MSGRILIITDYYLPGYKGGGPVRSIANLVEHLGDTFAFDILAPDRDFGDNTPYPNVRYGEWTPVGKARVRYLAPEERRMKTLGALISTLFSQLDYDMLYLNSFFAPMCAKILWARRAGYIAQDVPILLNPRGEFTRAALQHKRLKKRLYLTLVKAAKAARNLHWQTASEAEMKAIRREFPVTQNQAWIVEDLSASLGDSLPNIPDKRTDEPFKIVFLSRIARSKNLDFALNILAKTSRRIQFDLYGPIEDAHYWAECQALIDALPPNVQVSYQGTVAHGDVIQTFSQYHLFFFPTQSESYGHVIIESLYAGCPVLLSDRTPWRNLAEKNVGWDIPLESPERFVKAIETVAAMDAAAHQRHARAAQQFALTVVQNPAVVEETRRMFDSIINTKG